jgi:two-component system chemotaxis sensor kinase CheA
MFEAIKQNKSAELPINDAIQKLSLKEAPVEQVKSQHEEQAKPQHEEQAKPQHEKQVKSQHEEQVKPQHEEADVKKNQEEKKPTEDTESTGTIRVDLRRLDSLVNLVGELVIDRTRFARIEEELRTLGNIALGHAMSECVLLFSRHMNEVQNIIMKIRMVPVGNAFYKFTRVVRDLCRKIGKEIDLKIEGGETELDKTLVEEIADPLVHLIRNSVDHGIELPEEREKIGKSRKGCIQLKACQDGNMIVITIQDDGKGLQVDRIRSKAIERGLIKENDNLTNKEIFNLIFEPGFSTAEKVTNISGRGVGMDVVKKSIIKLKGIIDLDSTIGVGTTTTIKLPLTLAIIPSLMVEVNSESYAIPLVNVVESIRIQPEDIQHIGNADFVKLREHVLPLLRLNDIFDLHKKDSLIWYKSNDIKKTGYHTSLNDKNMTSKSGAFRSIHSKQRMIFVVVGVGEKRVGVIVDQLQGQQEIVIKSIGTLLGKRKGIAGGCVLGNGRVALVLDVGEMMEHFSQTKAGVE